jgi:acyl-CoA reductase-like NAD-dependent aldehyde dehydrogenase
MDDYYHVVDYCGRVAVASMTTHALADVGREELRAPLRARSLVAGRWRAETSGGGQTRIDPYRGTTASIAAVCGPAEVAEAEHAAAAAAASCGRRAPYARAEILERCAALVAEDREQLARAESLELGKPLRDTLGELDRAAETLAVAAAEARRVAGELLPAEGWRRGAGTTALSFRVPLGTVLAITPFNAPVNLLAHKLAASFAAGNATIVKAPPQAAATTSLFVETLLEAGLPTDAVQLLHGGAEVGAALTASPAVQAVSFTGSAVAGAAVAATAGPKRCVLELGGNAATIVCADADLATAARLCAATGYSNSGQSCISVQRVYVERPVYTAFAELLASAVRGLTVGDPLDPTTDVGCMVDEEAASRVESWIAEAVASGAELLVGGGRRGATLEPSLLGAPPLQAKVLVEEVFGDLVSIIPVDDFDAALAAANDTRFGLQAGLFTRDVEKIFAAARSLAVGAVVVNGTSNYRLDHLPFGGVKASGLGRESPRWLIDDFTAVKSLVFRDVSLWS